MAPNRESVENLERRVDELLKSRDDIQKKNEDLSTRVAEVESVFKAVKFFAALVGLSGVVIAGFLWQAIATGNSASSTAQTALNNAKEAQDAVDGLAETAVMEELQKQVPEAVRTRFAELASKLQVSVGESTFMDYLNGTENKDQQCKPGTVASGMSYGKTNHDYGLWCRPVGLVGNK
jgi:hypothetical protein